LYGLIAYVVGASAAYVPSFRASQVEPHAALRSQ